jgi:hypothetical protein
MTAFRTLKRILMSQALQSGSSFISGFFAETFKSRKKFSAMFVVLSLGLFALIQFSGIFDGAWAAQNVDVRAGRVESGEGRDLRAFVRSNPDNFMLMDGADVVKALDQPELTWGEFPGVIWQYRTDDCVVDIYFAAMQDDVSEAPVIHYEARSRDGKVEAIDANECVASLMRSKGGFFL